MSETMPLIFSSGTPRNRAYMVSISRPVRSSIRASNWNQTQTRKVKFMHGYDFYLKSLHSLHSGLKCFSKCFKDFLCIECYRVLSKIIFISWQRKQNENVTIYNVLSLYSVASAIWVLSQPFLSRHTTLLCGEPLRDDTTNGRKGD